MRLLTLYCVLCQCVWMYHGERVPASRRAQRREMQRARSEVHRPHDFFMTVTYNTTPAPRPERVTAPEKSTRARRPLCPRRRKGKARGRQQKQHKRKPCRKRKRTTPAPTTPSSCARCKIREEIKRLRIEFIKNEILHELGFDAPPNITNRSDVSNNPVIRSLVMDGSRGSQMQGDQPMPGGLVPESPGGGRQTDGSDDDNLRDQLVLNFSVLPVPEANATDKQVYFEFDEKTLDPSTLVSAELWVYRRGVNDGRNHESMLIVRPQFMPAIHRAFKLQPKDKGKWYKFEVKDVVIRWLKRKRPYYYLEIEAYDANGLSLAVTRPQEPEEEKFKPFLKIKIKSGSDPPRKELEGLECTEDDIETLCCRFPLVIDFEEFKWDWIIAPKQYHINYCSGDCPYVFMHKYPHTHVFSQSATTNAGPCCTPAKLSALWLIYFNTDNTVRYGRIQGLVVDRCGCA